MSGQPGSPDAHDGASSQGKAQSTLEPSHCLAVLNPHLLNEHRCQSVEEHCRDAVERT